MGVKKGVNSLRSWKLKRTLGLLAVSSLLQTYRPARSA